MRVDRRARRSRPPARCRRARRSPSRSDPRAVAAADAMPGIDIAALQVAARQHVVRRVRRGGRRAGRASAASTPSSGGSHGPGDRQLGVRRRLDAPPATDQRQHRLAAEAHLASAQAPAGRGGGRRCRRGSRRARRDAVRIAHQPGVRAMTASRSPSVKVALAWGERDDAHPEGASAGAASAPNMSVPATLALPSTRARRAPTRGRQTPAGLTPGHNGGRSTGSAPPGSDPAGDASITASTIFRYPVQRQSTPPSASSTCRARRAASGCARGNRWPPSACRACRCRTGPRRARGTPRAAAPSARPAPDLRPSRSHAPSAWALATRQAQTCAPSMQHRAGTAIAGVAADLGAGEAEAFAQRHGKRRERARPRR